VSAPTLREQIRDIYLSNAADLTAIPVVEDLSGCARFDAGRLSGTTGTAAPPAGPVEALVFDIYGTLVISASGDISIGEDNSSREHRIKRLLDEYDIDASPGDITAALKREVLADHDASRKNGVEYPEVDIRRIWAKVDDLAHLGDDDISLFAAEYETLVNPVAPMPGLPEMIACARESGLPMGIVSNAQFYTPAMFEALLGGSLLSLGFHPDLMVFSYRHGYGKPSLRLYEILAERLSSFQHPGHAVRAVPPQNCLYIGNDMLKDVWAAQQLGFQTAFFAGDRRSCRPRRDDTRCENLQADYLLHRLEDICPLIS
jgi:putative hydrolase of the HAD superfamily